MKSHSIPLAAFGALLLTFAASLPAQDLKAFEKRVTEFTLANGSPLHRKLERHDAPVVSFHTYVNTGLGADDPKSKTGLAHIKFEHIAFKGTDTIGTTNWPAEKAALAKEIETAYDKLDAERSEIRRVRSRKNQSTSGRHRQSCYREGRFLRGRESLSRRSSKKMAESA